jgi:hypothetical protein
MARKHPDQETFLQGLRREAQRAIESGAPHQEVQKHIEKELDAHGNTRFHDEWRAGRWMRSGKK